MDKISICKSPSRTIISAESSSNHSSSLSPSCRSISQIYIENAAFSEPLGSGTRLNPNSAASLGDKLPDQFKDKYIPQFTKVIAYLLWKERIVLPDYHSVKSSQRDLPLCHRALLSAVIRFSTDRFGEDDMSGFLRFVSTSVPNGADYLVPKSTNSLDKTLSASMSCIAMSWKAARSGMRQAALLEFYGLTSDQCKLVYSLRMQDSIAMTTMFTLSSICSQERGLGTPFAVHQYTTNDGGLGVAIGDQYLDCPGVKRIAEELFRLADELATKLFEGLDPSVKALLGGGIYVDVNDSDARLEAVFSFNIEVDGRTMTITSDFLNSELKRKLTGMVTKGEFDTWIAEYITLGKILQAAHGLLAPRRETENEAIFRKDGAGGLKRKLRWYNCFRSDCRGVPLCIFIRRKEKWSPIIDECVSVVHPQVTIHLILFSCLRPGVAAGIKASRHWKHSIPPDFLSMLFIGHSLMRERKGLGAENTNAHILSSVETLNAAKSELDPFLESFQAHSIRHFHQALLHEVLDKKNNLDGGTARTARSGIADSGIQGHSRMTGNGYVDPNLTTNDSLLINYSQMTDLVDIGRCLYAAMRLPFSLTSHWKNKTTLKRIEFKTLAQAMLFEKTDDFLTREKKAATFLKANPSLLARATNSQSSEGLAWDIDVLRGLAITLAVDDRPHDSTTPEKSLNSPASEGRISRHVLEVKLGCGRGKTQLIAVPALLQQHFVEKSNVTVTVVIVPNVNLMKDMKGELERMGLNVVEGKDIKDLLNLVFSSTGTGVVIAVLDTFLKLKNMQNALALLRAGKLIRLVFDEAHEFSLQKHFRPIFNQAIANLRNLKVNFTLLSGTFCAPVQEDVEKMLGLDPRTDRISSLTSTSDVVEAPQVRFERRHGNSKKEVLEAIVVFAATSAASKKHHLIAVLTKKHGEEILKLLKEKGVKTLFATADTRAHRDWDDKMTAWKDGSGDTFVLVSTQPLNGLNHKSLAVVDICGSHCLVTALQSALRVARTRGSYGTARFWIWDEMKLDSFGSDFEEDHLIFVCKLKAYEKLTGGVECLRKVADLCSAVGTSDTSDYAIRNMRGCPAVLVRGGALPCSVCHPDSIPAAFMATVEPIPPIEPSPRRSNPQGGIRRHELISGGLILTPDTVRAAVLKTASTLKTKGLCYYCCGGGCNSSVCQVLMDDVRSACFWCSGKFQHTRGLANCPLQPKTYCSKICSKCYDVNCTDLQDHTTSATDQLRRQSCANADLNTALIEQNFAIISSTLFDDHYCELFEAFLLENFKAAHRSLTAIARSAFDSKFQWLFDAMGGQVGEDQSVWNFNLVLLFRWNDHAKFNLAGSASSSKKSTNRDDSDYGSGDVVQPPTAQRVAGRAANSDNLRQAGGIGDGDDDFMQVDDDDTRFVDGDDGSMQVDDAETRGSATEFRDSRNSGLALSDLETSTAGGGSTQAGQVPKPVLIRNPYAAATTGGGRSVVLGNPYAKSTAGGGGSAQAGGGCTQAGQAPVVPGNPFSTSTTGGGGSARAGQATNAAVKSVAKAKVRHHVGLYGQKSSGDWTCPDCQYKNRRMELHCSQYRCHLRKPSWVKTSSEIIVKDNDWLCSCKYFNYGQLACARTKEVDGVTASCCKVQRPLWNEVTACHVIDCE